MGLISTTHNHYSKTEYVPYCTEVSVKEVKAPTDESVRLLNEMQDKARSNIIKTVELKENWIEATAIFYADELMLNQCRFHLRFKINNVEHFVETTIERHELEQASHRFYGIPELAWKFLVKIYSEAIAECLMKQVSDNLPFKNER